jgi:hypothetical protein
MSGGEGWRADHHDRAGVTVLPGKRDSPARTSKQERKRRVPFSIADQSKTNYPDLFMKIRFPAKNGGKAQGFPVHKPGQSGIHLKNSSQPSFFVTR